MKHERSRGYPRVDSDFAEALCAGEVNGSPQHRQAERKNNQLCRQVQRALNLALEERACGPASDGAFVDEVCPGPDCGHLAIHVVVPDGRVVADALTELRCDAARLRSEVAMAISRKHAPELFFVPLRADGSGEEHGNGGSDE